MQSKIKKISIIHSGSYNLDVLIEHVQKDDSLPASLEKLVEQIPQSSDKKEKYIEKFPYPKNNIIPRAEFLKYLKPAQQNQNRDPKSKAFVFYVPPSYLPSGNGWRALGMYDPLIHAIYISNDLSPKETEFVYPHEVSHALGVTDESIADSYAISRTGYKAA